jgi:CRP-like cAMP-binding protein
LIREGETGDFVAMLAEGTATVETDGRYVAALGPGSHVGEIALLYDVPRTATVRAQTNVVAWEIGQEAFLGAVTSVPGGRLPEFAVPATVHDSVEDRAPSTRP